MHGLAVEGLLITMSWVCHGGGWCSQLEGQMRPVELARLQNFFSEVANGRDSAAGVATQ